MLHVLKPQLSINIHVQRLSSLNYIFKFAESCTKDTEIDEDNHIS